MKKNFFYSAFLVSAISAANLVVVVVIYVLWLGSRSSYKGDILLTFESDITIPVTMMGLASLLSFACFRNFGLRYLSKDLTRLNGRIDFYIPRIWKFVRNFSLTQFSRLNKKLEKMF